MGKPISSEMVEEYDETPVDYELVREDSMELEGILG